MLDKLRFFFIFLLFKIITVDAYLFKLIVADSIDRWKVCGDSQCNADKTVMIDNKTKSFKRNIEFHGIDYSNFFPLYLDGKENVYFSFNCPDYNAIQVYKFYIIKTLNLRFVLDHNQPCKKHPCLCRIDQHVGFVKSEWDYEFQYYKDICVEKYCIARP